MRKVTLFGLAASPLVTRPASGGQAPTPGGPREDLVMADSGGDPMSLLRWAAMSNRELVRRNISRNAISVPNTPESYSARPCSPPRRRVDDLLDEEKETAEYLQGEQAGQDHPSTP